MKKPPRERPESAQTRRYVILSFWVVALGLGLPMWLWTTSIHRAVLPLQEMLDWAEGKACSLNLPLRIAFDSSHLKDEESQKILQATQSQLDQLSGLGAYSFQINLAPPSKKQPNEAEDALRIVLSPRETESSLSAGLLPQSETLEVSYATSLLSTDEGFNSLAQSLAARTVDIFKEESAYLAYELTKAQAELKRKVIRRKGRALKYSPSYHITVSLFTPTSTPSSWDIENAVQEYLTPLLEAYSISNFTVETQVQLFATLSPSAKHPEYDEENKLWTLRTEDLSSFVNSAEWPLSPSIGEGPSLNFVLYVPDEKMSPLVVKETGVTSWLVPQWGGVAILNPSTTKTSTAPHHLSKETLRGPFRTFSQQVLPLLGAPDTPASSFPLQMCSATRIQAVALHKSAASTMGSLAQLVRSLPTMPIPENVAAEVDVTLASLRESCKCIRGGRFDEALEAGRVAEKQAERAFFDKSMVGQVYFPDEHKVAVYLPLLGPIAVPLVMSALKELKKARDRRRSTTG